jgi:hypothetical protein
MTSMDSSPAPSSLSMARPDRQGRAGRQGRQAGCGYWAPGAEGRQDPSCVECVREIRWPPGRASPETQISGALGLAPLSLAIHCRIANAN